MEPWETITAILGAILGREGVAHVARKRRAAPEPPEIHECPHAVQECIGCRALEQRVHALERKAEREELLDELAERYGIGPRTGGG